jgi:hypothetical protein
VTLAKFLLHLELLPPSLKQEEQPHSTGWSHSKRTILQRKVENRKAFFQRKRRLVSVWSGLLKNSTIHSKIKGQFKISKAF